MNKNYFKKVLTPLGKSEIIEKDDHTSFLGTFCIHGHHVERIIYRFKRLKELMNKNLSIQQTDEQRKIIQLERMCSMWLTWAEIELRKQPDNQELGYLVAMARSIEPMAEEEPEDHSDDIRPCGDPDCNRPFNHS